MKQSNYAYTTLISGDDYFWGAVCLYFSLKKMKCKYPLILMMNKCSEEIVNIAYEFAANYTDIIVKEITYDYFRMSGTNYYEGTINKFQFLNFKEYDKIMFLDADVILDQNLDEIFEYNEPYYTYNYDALFEDHSEHRFWGGSFLLRPIDFDYQEILNTYLDKYLEDELVLLDMLLKKYPEAMEVMEQHTEWHTIIYHLKYWKIFNLYSIDRCYQFIESELYKNSEVGYIQQRGFY